MCVLPVYLKLCFGQTGASACLWCGVLELRVGDMQKSIDLCFTVGVVSCAVLSEDK